ncbi:hypothetical protein BH24CHL10_BH24CHL10_12470 [soil metagenome]
MNTDAMERKLQDLYSSGDVQELARQIPGLATADLVQEWPQSGERIRRRDNVMGCERGLRRRDRDGAQIDASPHRQAWGGVDRRGHRDYGDGTPVSLVSILEAEADGRITRQTDLGAASVRW